MDVKPQTEIYFNSQISVCMKERHFLQYKTFKTSHGMIAYVDTGGPGFPVVLIHGNSCSSEVFKKQIAAFRNHYRMISVDLPGHGRSSCPDDPDNTYAIPGYASVIHEIVNHLELGPFAIIGYSLGGNIALQWTQISKDPIKGIMLVSCAPMKYSNEVFKAYPPYEGSFAAYPNALSESQAKQYMSTCGFNVENPSVYFMIEDAMKTDGKSRSKMAESVLAGKGIDETEIVNNLTIPLAIVVGREDPALGLNYITHLNYRNLWHGKIEFIEHAQHALPVHQADQLHQLIEDFLIDIKKN